jgi:hypothetical protein
MTEELDKYLNAPRPPITAPIEEPEEYITKSPLGLVKEAFKPSAPDFICAVQPSVCAWIDKVNTAGEVITLNLKVGELRFKLQKRFL